jgi:hypothetical protein
MKSVAIIGCATGWEDAPLDGECWGITNIILRRDMTRTFDIHDLTWSVQQWYDHYMMWMPGFYGANALLAKAQRRLEQVPLVLKRVKELKIPLYSTAKYKGVPTSRLYPIKKVGEHFQMRFLASTVDYAFVLALFEGFKSIDLYGVKMSFGEEYEHQLKSFHYWIGLAHGMGVTVNVHGEGVAVLKTKNGLMYGYNTEI